MPQSNASPSAETVHDNRETSVLEFSEEAIPLDVENPLFPRQHGCNDCRGMSLAPI